MENKKYKLMGADGKIYESDTKGQLGGHKKLKIYGRLDCKSAERYIAKGEYVANRVFFKDEETAIAAGYRPCAICMPEEYEAWKEKVKIETEEYKRKNTVLKSDEYIRLVTTGNQNTYKYALGYALAVLNPKEERVAFEEIAEIVVDFYYTRAILPNIRHSNNKKQVPIIIQDMQSVLEEYPYIIGVEELPRELKKKMVEKVISNTKNGFFRYVLPCWEGAQKNEKGNYLYPKEGENGYFSYSLEKKEMVLCSAFMNIILRDSEKIKVEILEQLELFLKKYNKKMDI